MTRLILESWILLLRFEIALCLRHFRSMHQRVREEPVKIVEPRNLVSCADLRRAVDCASVLYFKRVQCLQHSCATTLLLRRNGWSAELVIGAQLMPFKSHAWVEVNGCVVNDRPYVTEMYQVLERC